MRKVVCVKNINEQGVRLALTLGKIYDDVGSGKFTTDVVNDNGNLVDYMKDRFVDISYVRNEKIEKLLEE